MVDDVAGAGVGAVGPWDAVVAGAPAGGGAGADILVRAGPLSVRISFYFCLFIFIFLFCFSRSSFFSSIFSPTQECLV